MYIYLLMHFLDGLGNLYLFQMENKWRTRLDVMKNIQAEAITKLEVCLYSFQKVLNELITFLG